MSQPDIIIVGASVRSLAESAVRDGLRPYCVDMFGDADLMRLLSDRFGEHDKLFRRIKSFDEIPEATQELPATIPVLVSGGVENYPDVLCQLQQKRILLGIDPVTVAQLRTPTVFFQAMQRNGIAVPDWRRCDDASVPVEDAWLRKSFRSAGGVGVSRLTARTLTTQRASPSDEAFLQRVVPGPTASAAFVASDSFNRLNGRRSVQLLGISLQISGAVELNAPEFQFCGNLGPLAVCSSLEQKIRGIGQVVANEWNVAGVFGVDFVVYDGQPVVLEVNPRITASHELYERSVPGQSGQVAMLLAEKVECKPSQRHSLAKNTGVAWSEADVTKDALLRLVMYSNDTFTLSRSTQQRMLEQCKFEQTVDSSNPQAWLADVPLANSRILSGTPLCSVYLSLPKAYVSTGSDSSTGQHRTLPRRLLAELDDVWRSLPLRSTIDPAPLLHGLQAQIALLQCHQDLKQ